MGNRRIFIGGDIVTAVEGTPITSLDALQILLETRYKVGDEVVVTVIREGKEMSITVQLSEELMP